MRNLMFLAALSFLFVSCDDTAKKSFIVPISTTINNNLASNTIGAKVRMHADLPIDSSDNTFTTVPFDAESYDTDGIHDTAANQTRLTANTAGLYLIVAKANFAANGTGVRSLRVTLNGNPDALVDETRTNACAGYSTYVQSTVYYNLQEDDYIEMQVHQYDGGDDLNVLANLTYFSMVKLSD